MIVRHSCDDWKCDWDNIKHVTPSQGMILKCGSKTKDDWKDYERIKLKMIDGHDR